MAEELLIRITREALYLAILLSAPVIVATFIVNLFTGALQAATQIQGPALQTLPRLVIAALTLVLLGPWIGDQLLRFAMVVFQALPIAAR